MRDAAYYFFVAMFVLGCVSIVSSIGKPRKPVTRSYACSYIIAAVIEYGLLTYIWRT